MIDKDLQDLIDDELLSMKELTKTKIAEGTECLFLCVLSNDDGDLHYNYRSTSKDKDSALDLILGVNEAMSVFIKSIER